MMMYRDYAERYSIVGDGRWAIAAPRHRATRAAPRANSSVVSAIRRVSAIAPAQPLRDRLNCKARIERSAAIAIIAFATGLAAVGLPFAVVEWLA